MPGHPTRTRGPLVLAVAAATLVAGIVALPASAGRRQAEPASAQPPLPTGCAGPYAPNWAEVTYPVGAPVVAPWAGGTDLSPTDPPVLDTDGDGAADTLTDLADNAFSITRASGTITLPDHTYLANRFDAADLDGDGGTDLIVITPTSSPNPGTYVVPGSAPDGAIDLATEAIAVPQVIGGAITVGDQDGDGGTDLAVPTDTGASPGTDVFRGVDVTAPGPGGTFAGAPVRSYAGAFTGALPFDPTAPTITTSDNIGAGGADVTFVVHGVPEFTLTTTGGGISLPGTSVYTEPARLGLVLAPNGHLWVALALGDRSGSKGWGWDLTDLCQTPVGPTPADPAPASPAAPVGATARYTG